jgi:hypothetical protein
MRAFMGTIRQAFWLFWEALGHVGRVRTIIDIAGSVGIGAVTAWLALGSLSLVWAILIGAIIFALVAFALLVLDIRRKSAPPTPRRVRLFTKQPMTGYLGPAVLALVGLLVILGAAYWWYSIAYRAQDIAWGFDPPKNQFFLGLSRSGSDEAWVESFQTEAQNLTGEPILNVNSYIRSDFNNRQVPVLFNIGGTRVAPADTEGITRDGYFQLSSEPFPSPDPKKTQGMPVSRFRSTFGPFNWRRCPRGMH